MPPKKKAPTKAAGPSEKEQLQDAQAEVVALKRLLELKTFEAVEARELERTWRGRAEAAEAAVEQARLDMADIKADISRQHTTLQEQSTQQVLLLEERVAGLQQQLTAAQQAANTSAAQSTQLLQEKEQQVVALQQEVERLHSQFAAALQHTLSSIRTKMEQEYSMASGVN